MAVGVKISQLPVATSLTGLELAVVVQEGETRQTTVGAFSSDVSSRIDAVSASLSALDTRVGLVSARTSVNAAAITSINAVVSLKAFRTGDYLDAVQYIEFDTSTVVPSSVGRLSWNRDDGTLNLGLIGGNVVNQLGQELVQRCYNNTGAPIAEGSVVKVVGATGQRLTIELAQANNDANSLTVIGVATETIPNKALGYVATEGFVRSVNTQGFSDGDVLWLSPTTPGQLTNVKPVAPQHMVMVGYVVKGGSVGAGSIFVKVQNGYELGELHDVKVSTTTSLANNEILAYNTSAGVWTNSTLLIDVQNSISALTDRVAAVSAATSVNAATVSALEIRVSSVSARVSSNAAAIVSTNNVVSALEIRVSNISTAVSVLQQEVALVNTSAVNARIDAVSAATSANAAAITSVNGVVSALEIRVSNVSAATVSVGQTVSALEVRVSSVSAAAAANAAAIVSVNNVVSALADRVAATSATVSALVITVEAVSARTSVNAAAIASVNNVVSALEIRVSAVSAAVVAASAAITSVNAVVSLKVNRSGDTMTGNLTVPSINSGPLAGFRNAIINGNFDIWQRGTSFTNPAAFTGYTADRWVPFYDGSGATRTLSRQTFTVGQTDVPGEPTYFLRYAQSAAGSGATYNPLVQKIEGVRTFAGQQVTLSFYAKAAASLTLPVIALRQQFGTGGSPSGIVDSYLVSNQAITTSWAKYTYTTTLSSIAGKTIGNDNNDTLELLIELPINTTFTFDLAQVQLEAGPVATPFERRPLGTELALCQRYYQTVTSFTNCYGAIYATGSNTFHGDIIPLTTSMRAAPTTSLSVLSNAFYWVTPETTPFSANSTAGVTVDTTQHVIRLRQVRQAGNTTPSDGFYVMEASFSIACSAEL